MNAQETVAHSTYDECMERAREDLRNAELWAGRAQQAHENGNHALAESYEKEAERYRASASHWQKVAEDQLA